MKKVVLLMSVIGLFFINGFAQTYSIGEKVEFECNCPTQWVNGTIEEAQIGNTYRIRFGNGRNDYQNGISTQRIRKPGQGANISKQNELRNQFMQEARQYSESVYSMMVVHDPNLRVGNNTYGPPVNASGWTKTMNDLAALDNLCKTKYAGMQNDPNSPWKNDLAQLPATWCEIAARRNEYQQKGKSVGVAMQLDPIKNGILRDLDSKLNADAPYLSYDHQFLMFEPETWKANYKKKTPDLPDSFFAEIITKAAELKSKTERDAPNRTFKMPPYQDAAIQNQIRNAYASQLKGTQIIKIGMDYTTWKIWKNSLGIPTSQTKRGRVLAKVPNRPFCQEQEFVVVKDYTGGGSFGATKIQNGVGSAGLFMNCN